MKILLGSHKPIEVSKKIQKIIFGCFALALISFGISLLGINVGIVRLTAGVMLIYYGLKIAETLGDKK
jgi:hypothetical protein